MTERLKWLQVAERPHAERHDREKTAHGQRHTHRHSSIIHAAANNITIVNRSSATAELDDRS